MTDAPRMTARQRAYLKFLVRQRTASQRVTGKMLMETQAAGWIEPYRMPVRNGQDAIKAIWTITDAGRAALDAHMAELGDTP